MAPYIYPITKELCNVVNPQRSKSALPMLQGESIDGTLSTLARVAQKPIDNYLKKVIRHMKETFEMLMILDFEFFVNTPDGTPVFYWRITIKQVLKRHDNLKMLEALGVLNNVFSRCHLLLNKITHVGEAEVEDFKMLKEQLFELVGYLDKILLFYSNAGLQESSKPTIDQIKHVVKKSRSYLMNLKPERLKSLLPNMAVKEEDILCSVLGLSDEFAERLANLSPGVRSHQSDKYFLLGFLEEDAKYTGSLTDQITMATKLEEMGFTANRSLVVAEWIAKQPYPNHQTLFSWAQDYIEKLFTYDIFLNDNVPNYPFHENKVGEWFPVKQDEDDAGAVTAEVQVLNTTPNELEKFIQGKQQEYNEQHPGKHLYFHGTDHAGAQNILEGGINVGAGKRQCEFSRGCGFYLCTSSKFAIDWTKKHEASAIVMFTIDDWLSEYLCLDLTSDESASDLQKLKNHCREHERLPKTLSLSYKACDYVKGPITQVESCHQICIRKQSMADEIGDVRKIHGIIFVRRTTNIL